MKQTRKTYEDYLNGLYDVQQVIELTEHCWSGNDKTQKEKNHAKKLANKRLYGTILRKYDKIAFNIGFNEYVRN
jgi:hypothetical protein